MTNSTRAVTPHATILSADSLQRRDYSDAYEVDAEEANRWTAEEWARATFEKAPLLLRSFVAVGWKYALRLNLGPPSDIEHILGAKIVRRGVGAITMEMDGPVLRAHLVFLVEQSQVTLATLVNYKHPIARLVWPIAAQLHIRTAPFLLDGAAARLAGRRPNAGPRPAVTAVQRYVSNPLFRRISRFVPGSAVVETIGRNSGLPRRTPVGGVLEGSSFWLVSEFGRRSNYVRNIEVDPRVRVQIDGRWRSGTARLLDDDDAKARLAALPRLNSTMVRLVGTDLLTIRIDLDAGR